MTELKRAQLDALVASRNKRGFAYFMEMGLGKTFTILTEFEELVGEKKVSRLVVVVPNSFKSGWRAEILKHGFDYDVHIFNSGGDNSWVRGPFTRPPVLIVNYEAIRREHVRETIYLFVRSRKAMIVFDESIQLKNNKSQQTKAAIELGRVFEYRRILSGKPTTQGPHDLWGQMRAIGELNGTNYYAFRGVFCRMGGYMNKKVVGAQNEELLGKTIGPHAFYATKKDYLDLPPKLYTVRDVEMTPEQARAYKSMEEEFVTWLNEEGDNVSVDMALTKHIKLAQIQFGFIMDDMGEIHEIVNPTQNPRINLAKELLDDEVVGKMVIVHHHKYVGTLIRQELSPYGLTEIIGGMKPDEIEKSRDDFNNKPHHRVISVQTTVGRYGHTLVGTGPIEEQCSTMLFLENTWSLDTRSQLEDRIHRMGQVGESCLYVDVVSSKLDRAIIRALQDKENIFQAVMAHIRGPSLLKDPTL